MPAGEGRLTKRVQTVLDALEVTPEHPLRPVLGDWCAGSKAFLAFAEANATKIRRKVRQAGTEETRRDLLSELAVVHGFLTDTHFTVQYEPFKAGGERSPDLQVVLKGHTPLNVEVTCLRQTGTLDETTRLARLLCDKIGQCPAGVGNLLLVVLPREAITEGLVPGAVRLLNQPPGNAALHPQAVRDFQRGRVRLGGVALGVLGESGVGVVILWLNPQARQPVHPEVVKFLRRWPPSG